jgi:hypothetical protein
MFGHMPFNCALTLLVSQAVLLQSQGYYAEWSGCGMQAVYTAARDINLVPEYDKIIYSNTTYIYNH